MFDITPMLNQPFRTFGTAKNASFSDSGELNKYSFSQLIDMYTNWNTDGLYLLKDKDKPKTKNDIIKIILSDLSINGSSWGIRSIDDFIKKYR